MSNEHMITTDSPLNDSQHERLLSLQDVIIPASDDGRLPSAAEMNVILYIQTYASEFIPELAILLDDLDTHFSTQNYIERHAIAESLSKNQTERFTILVSQIFACYYQDKRVQKAIGMGEGPPFPRGNTIEAGDLSLLDSVLNRSISYRKP